VKYAWIKQQVAEFSVKSMCRFMSVSRSAYYVRLERPQTAIKNDDAELIEIKGVVSWCLLLLNIGITDL